MPRILVVDDEPDSLLAARAALVAAGHDCVLAATGERALELLAAGDFDAVVLDPTMPLHDGWPVLAAAGDAPVVVMSAALRPSSATTAAPLPFPAVSPVAAAVPKPISAADLVAAVSSALAR
jgi:CheY-like chemotaxis protein